VELQETSQVPELIGLATELTDANITLLALDLLNKPVHT